jgi:integrase
MAGQRLQGKRAGNPSAKLYLQQRGDSWYFRRAVPADIRDKWNGRQPILVALNTRDLNTAQSERWKVNAKFEEQFDRLRGRFTDSPLTPEQIEELAKVKFHSTLETLNDFQMDDGALTQAAGVKQRQIDLGDPSKDHGELGPGKPERLTDLKYALLRAELEAILARQSALKGIAGSAPETFGRNAIDPVSLKPVASVRRSVSGPLFSAVAARSIAERQRDPKQKLTEQTRRQYELCHRLFDSFADQPKLNDVDRPMASKFLDQVATLNPDWGRTTQTRNSSFKQIMKSHGNHATGLSNKTVNRFASVLSLVWKFAEVRDGYNGLNPWANQGRKVGGQRGKPGNSKRAWRPDEIKVLLQTIPVIAPNKHSMETALPWLVLLAAFSGARINELSSFEVCDVKELGGIWYFDITEAKSEAGVRFIPLHSKIIAAGFLDYIKRIGSGQIFPSLKPGGPDGKLGWYPSKRFTVYRRQRGLVDIDKATGKDRVDFHSLRRAASTALKQARIAEHEAAEVIGHEHKAITYGLYADRARLKELQTVVEAIKYEGV